MGNGVEIPSLPCCFCKNTVSFFDVLYFEGRSYHDHCFRMELSRELSRLDKKKQLGTITLAEANLEKDIQYNLDLSRNQNEPTPYNKKSPHQFCQKTGFGFLDSSNVKIFTTSDGQHKSGEYIKLPAMRIASYQSVQEAKFKELEASRSLRWAWESFGLLDGGLLLLNSQDTKQLEEGKIS